MTGEARTAALRDQMAAWDPAGSALVLDLDGTLHAGRWRWARGLTSVDLGYEIGWMRRPLGLPIPPPLFTWRVARYWLHERALAQRAGDRAAYYRDAITAYRSTILRGITPATIADAAQRILRHAHRDLAAALPRVGARFASARILSKGFEPVVAAYTMHVAALLGIPVGGEGNAIEEGEPPRFVSGEDKGAALATWLECAGARHVLVVGDTRQDLAMRDAAAVRLGADNAAIVALAPKSDDFAAAADAAFATWTALADALG